MGTNLFYLVVQVLYACASPNHSGQPSGIKLSAFKKGRCAVMSSGLQLNWCSVSLKITDCVLDTRQVMLQNNWIPENLISVT